MRMSIAQAAKVDSKMVVAGPTIFLINRQCAGAPKTLTLVNNVLYELLFEFPFKHENAEIKGNICSKKVVTKGGLLYYNLEHEAKMNRLSIQQLNKVWIAE